MEFSVSDGSARLSELQFGDSGDKLIYVGPSDALNYVTKFNSNDGSTVSKSNITDDGTITKILSPDTLSTVEVTDNNVEVYVNEDKRLEIDVFKSLLTSPDTANNFITNNFFSQISQANNPRVKIDANVSQLISPDLQKTVKVENNEVKIESGGNGRIKVNNSCSCIVAPNGNDAIEVRDTVLYLTNGLGASYTLPLTTSPSLGQTLIADNSGNLLFSNLPSNAESITSPSGLNTVEAEDTKVSIKYNGIDRMFSDATNTSLLSPNSTANLDISNGLITMDNNSGRVFESNSISTEIRNISQISKLRIGGPALGFSYIYNNQSRIIANIASTILFGPDGTNVLTIDDDGVTLGGATNTIDGKYLQLGSSSVVTPKGISMLFLANTSFDAGSLLKIVDSGGSARVTPVASADPADTPIFGVAITSAGAAGDDVEVCIGGMFECIVENGQTINIGDPIGKSNVDSGRVSTFASSVGTFGVSLSAGTGDVGGTVKIRALFSKNERA